MITVCYSCLLSLLYLLFITHWANAATLRSSSNWPLDRRQPSFIVNTELTTPEPILFRRRPQLISSERRRRWSVDDEVEIPIDETDIDPSTNTFTIDNQSTEASDDISSFNSTIAEINHSLFRQDLDVLNQTDELTTIAMNDEISENNNTNIEQSVETTTSDDINSTESEILPTKVMDVSQETSNETNNNETEIVSTPVSIQQNTEETSTISETELSTLHESKQDTAIILLDYTTIPPTTIDANQTSADSKPEILLEYNTTMANEVVNVTTVLDEIQNTMTTEVADQGIDSITTLSDVTQNETSTVIFDDNEYSNETLSLLPTTTAKPICDQSCQCSRKCPYGFEILNNTCQCDPPCTNYQCFGNDTCSVSKKGQPVCQPEKGNEHDRPFRCYQPRDAGYHDDDIRYYNRWYYNPDQDTCHLFVYRGLGGNENNFQSLHECHLECITCAPSPDPGSCLAFIPMWYYDYKKNQCSQFNYSGCKGNENKFLRKQECIDTCITRILNL